jgi:hypothetical protein
MTALGRVAGARLALGVAIATILVLTLYPSAAHELAPFDLCLICGTRGTSDAILNVALFVPLGVALAMNGFSVARAAAIAFALSLAIEVTQLWVPGRDPSFGDLTFNTVGGAVGSLLVRRRTAWLAPERAVAARYSLAAAAAVLLVVVSTGMLFRPYLPETRYYGQWTPVLGHFHPYDGRVLDARVGDVRVPPGASLAQRELRGSLGAGAPIRVQGVAGSPTPRLASVFSIYDEDSVEILVVGRDGDDLVFREGVRAAVFRLHVPARRVGDLMAGVRKGDPVTLRVDKEGTTVCLSVNDRRECGVGRTAAAGRRLLYDRESWSEGARTGLDAVWLGLLLLPFGFWARRRWESYLGLAVAGAALFVAPSAVGLITPGPIELLGSTLGLLLGLGLRRGVDRGALTREAGPMGGRARGERAHQLGQATVDP